MNTKFSKSYNNTVVMLRSETTMSKHAARPSETMQ
jgi:hypothetical protein